MSRRDFTLLIAFWLVILIGLTGCLGGGSAPIRIKGSMEAGESVNRDLGDRPSPIVVRIYHLRSPTIFQSADFLALFSDATATLGQNMVTWDEFVLKPGESRAYDTELDPSTQYLGIFAAYRDYENAHWRELVVVPEKKKVLLQIKLESLAVSVVTD